MFKKILFACILASLLVSLGCGGTEKGKNKDFDRPKTADTR